MTALTAVPNYGEWLATNTVSRLESSAFCGYVSPAMYYIDQGGKKK